MAPSLHRLRSLPSVDRLLAHPSAGELLEKFRHELVVDAIRNVLGDLRRPEHGSSSKSAPADHATDIDPTPERLIAMVSADLRHILTPTPRRVINATGIALHTNLGRAELPLEAVEAIQRVAASACSLEFDVGTGGRGSRDQGAAAHLTALTGAEAATVVNNNAAAVLLALNSLAQGREVIVSRGELVEIGGSFRIPDILAKSGARLREVGTTNRTHLRDYADAVDSETGLLLKVHPSNYSIAGFTAEVSLEDLVGLGRERGVAVVEDLGSGALVDLAAFGLPREPMVAERVGAGADAVTFSGDKLLGGPQAGLIVGRADALAKMTSNPLKRALRCDKLTLAALDATLCLYRAAPDLKRALPTLRYLSRDLDEIARVARDAAESIRAALGTEFDIRVEKAHSQIGSGAQPTANIESRAVVISHQRTSPLEIAALFRAADPPIIGRVHDDRFWLDTRCIDDPDDLVPQHPARPS